MKDFTFFNRPFHFLTEQEQWVKLQDYLNRFLFSNYYGKIAVEAAQYVFAKGNSSVEDVLVYLIGGFVGIILASPFCLVAQYLEERKRGSNRGEYDYEDY